MKKEIRLSIINMWFLIPLILFVSISIIQSYNSIAEYNAFISSITEEDKSVGNCCFPVCTSFNLWIGNSNSLYSKILFYVAPFLAALPYSWSYCRDLKKNAYLKAENKIDYISKLVGVFISSGLLIAIPLFINFVCVSIFVPTVKPDSAYNIYYRLFSDNLIGELFYNVPYIYILFYIIVNFIIYGLLGSIGLSFSTFFNSRYMAVFVPTILIVIIEVLKTLLSRFTNTEISLLAYMYPADAYYDRGGVLFSEIIVLMLIVFVFSKIGVKNEN